MSNMVKLINGQTNLKKGDLTVVYVDSVEGSGFWFYLVLSDPVFEKDYFGEERLIARALYWDRVSGLRKTMIIDTCVFCHPNGASRHRIISSGKEQ